MVGQIQIDTVPSDLAVYVDEQYMGNSGEPPLMVSNISAGEHIVRIENGFPFIENVVVYDNKITQLTAYIDDNQSDIKYKDITPSIPNTETGLLTKVTKEGLEVLTNTVQGLVDIQDKQLQYKEQEQGYDPNFKPFASNLIAITTAVPNPPIDENVIACQDATLPVQVTTGLLGYDVVPVNEILGRNSPELSLFPVGTVSIFVRASSDGKNFSQEIEVTKGTRHRFVNVYQLRVRSIFAGIINKVISGISVPGGGSVFVYPAGGVYQITEHKTENDLVNVNKTAILTVLKSVTPPGISITVPNNSINTVVSLRAHINNTGYIFVGNSSAAVAAATFPPTTDGFYHTLEAGATERWNLAQGAQLFINASTTGQFVEFGQEADA